MYDHNEIQSELRNQLRSFSQIAHTGWEIRIEEVIDPLVTAGTRRIDVAARTDQSHQKGYAFEVKTINSSGRYLFWQLRDYLIAGFRPILVGPKSIVEGAIPGTSVQWSWLLRLFDTTLVVIEADDPLELNLRRSRLSPNDGQIEMFFEQFC